MSLPCPKNVRQKPQKLQNSYISKQSHQKITLDKWKSSVPAETQVMICAQSIVNQLAPVSLGSCKERIDRKTKPVEIKETSSEIKTMISEEVKRQRNLSEVPKNNTSNENYTNKCKGEENTSFEFFIQGKEKLEFMVNEIHEKQAEIFSLYCKLVELKKVLGDNGLNVHLKPMTFIDYGKDFEQIYEGGDKITLNPDLLKSMKNIIDQIPFGLQNICTYLLETQKIIQTKLKNYLPNGVDKNSLGNIVNTLENENTDVNERLSAVLEEKDELCRKLIIKWAQLLKTKNSESIPLNKIYKTLVKVDSETVSNQDKQLKETLLEVKQRIYNLEKHVYVERTTKHDSDEETIRILKCKLEELNAIKADFEKQIRELSNDLQKAQAETNEINECNHNLNRDLSEKITAMAAKYHDVEEMLTKQNQYIEDLQMQLHEKNKKITAVNERNSELEKQLASIREKKAKLQETVNFIETELIATKTQIREFDDTSKIKKKNINKLK